MVLKKSDKIIAIVGVLILVIAAISIVVLYSPSEKVGETGTVMKTFSVTWIKGTGTVPMNKDDLYAGKKSPYANTTDVEAPEGSVLTNVQFELTWEDDHIYGLIFKRGLDTLSAEIACGDELQPYSEKGGGNNTFSFDIEYQPQDESVDAENISEVEQAIKNKYSDKNKASFDVTVKVKTGEKLRRPLKFLKDKGNDFDLVVSYEYYYPQIIEEEPETGGDDGYDETTQNEAAHESLMITNLARW